jgi:hypothetical protein
MDLSNKPPAEPIFLQQVERLVDWQPLQPQIDAIDAVVHGGVPRAAIKLLLLARWYGLSDHALEESCHDRISFRRFLGLPLEDGAGDAALIRAARLSLVHAQAPTQDLVHEVEQQLLAKGFTVKAGMWAEAAIVAMPAALTEQEPESDTTVFAPGELAKEVRLAEPLLARAGAQVADRTPTTGSGKPQTPPPPTDPAPVYAVIDWPWGVTTELKQHLNIGRQFGFCPFARELQRYTHISRKHAELLVYGDGIWVRDLGSRNGTFVDDEEVPTGQAYLVDSDSRIRFGPQFVILLKLKPLS